MNRYERPSDYRDYGIILQCEKAVIHFSIQDEMYHVYKVDKDGMWHFYYCDNDEIDQRSDDLKFLTLE